MKAILVIDIPDGYGDIYDNKAVVTLRNGKLGTSLGIYNVPLKPMPEKYELYDLNEQPEEILANAEAIGWNDCIDEITGETE